MVLKSREHLKLIFMKDKLISEQTIVFFPRFYELHYKLAGGQNVLLPNQIEEIFDNKYFWKESINALKLMKLILLTEHVLAFVKTCQKSF